MSRLQSNGKGHADEWKQLLNPTTADNEYLPTKAEAVVAEYELGRCGFADRCPRLYTLLAKRLVANAKRELATVRLFVDGGRLKAAVHDRESGKTFWTTLEAAGAPCDELEANLANGVGEWRQDRTKR